MVAFDEMTLSDGTIRPAYADLAHWLATTPRELLTHRRNEAELLFRRIGITFAVYGDKAGAERALVEQVFCLPKAQDGAEIEIDRGGEAASGFGHALGAGDIGGQRLLGKDG